MRLPKKIDPDNIKEAFIEVRYNTGYSYEIIPGVFYKAFDDSYTYTAKPLKQNQTQKAPQLPREIRLTFGNESFLYNDNIIIQIIPNAFIFSCLGKYVGWKNYKSEIEKALRTIATTEIIDHWTRIGVRYISEYPKMDLRDSTKFKYSFGHPAINSRFVAFKSEFEYNKSKIILNLNNLLPVVVANEKNPSSETVPTSTIDVDVIKDNLRLSGGTDELLNLIEEAHEQEKQLFFGMLEEKFIETLNPEY
jgi:uncharacterized protein (TIGR04255 family)